MQLSDRPDRFFCLPLLWRVCEKRDGKIKAQHRTKPRLAAEMIGVLAGCVLARLNHSLPHGRATRATSSGSSHRLATD